jgi:L-threonylcarbamoyladenylate synthase
VKNRPSFDPLIVHIGRWEQAEEFVLELPEAARKLAVPVHARSADLAPPQKDRLPDIVTAGSPNVAVRMPNHPVTIELLHILDFPLAAPSANPFGYISPTTAQHVADQLEELVPYIHGRRRPARSGSSRPFSGLRMASSTIYRKGGLSIEMIEAEIGPVSHKSILHFESSGPGDAT